MAKDVFAPDPEGVLPVYLRPGSQGHLFESEVVINSLGFRGKEFARQKGNSYRIVVLGESTTFGCTLNRDDKPWPELLESMINTRLHLTHPVEVINAGVPACSLNHNVHRIPRDILPLQPDVLISYHGINGFRMLDPALPSLGDKTPPVYRQRPLKILADCEYRLNVLIYRHRQTARLLLRRAPDADLMKSEYAESYRQLIALARSNNVQLALANFSMAVNPQSATGPIEFYGSAFPAVRWLIRANTAHNQIVQRIAGAYPQVFFINTQPNLDGEYGKFIDLVHLTQPGRQQLAENVFAGLTNLLDRTLGGHPRESQSRSD
jgi:lysophospholipase L1-like esterase